MAQRSWWLGACAASLLACGDNTDGPVPPIAELGCRKVQLRNIATQFDTSGDLGSVVGNTLADTDLSGRWFMTGAYLGNSTMVLARMGASYTNGNFTFAPSDTELFATDLRDLSPMDPKTTVRVSERISNLRDDGTLRYELAICREETEACDVCTARMIRAERHDPKPAENMSLASEYADPAWKGITLDVKVLGYTAFLIRDTGLHTFDVTDPTNPRPLGFYPNSDRDTRSNDVEIITAASTGRRYALIADAPVEVVDVTNPSDMRLVATIPVEAHTLVAETRAGATRAYFGSLDGTCPVYDLTDPTQPARLGAFDAHASYVHDLSVHDGIAYLNAWEKGFFVVDFTNPADPQRLGHWQPRLGASHANWTTVAADGRRIAVHGEETYGAHLTILDVDPTSPYFMGRLGEYETREYVSIHNFTGTGTKTYFTYYQDGVRVLDIADPLRPALLGYFNTWDPNDPKASTSFFAGAIGLDLDVTRKLVFVADVYRGLLILRDDT